MGISLNGGTPFSHPKFWSFLVWKPMGQLGTTSGCLQHHLAAGKLHALLLQAKEFLMKPLSLLRQGVEHLSSNTRGVKKISSLATTNDLKKNMESCPTSQNVGEKRHQ